MTGPEGDQPHGYWDIVSADPPRSLVINDGFADDTGEPDPSYPISGAEVTIEAIGAGRTRMIIDSTFPTVEAMEQMLAMGMEQGLTDAVGQIDALLSELPVA
jgi:uncharacterized protein YndB with AHSA1/START domain